MHRDFSRYVKTAVGCALLFTFAHSYSQPETTKWIFGDSVFLDFSQGNPVSLPGSAMATNEGCASIADASGNLLFYTNGVHVWNKNHQLMTGTLAGDESSTQSALIVRQPGHTNLYYVFTVGAWGAGDLCYSVVDMSLAAGLGSLTTLNVQVLDSVSEKLTGTLHCNGTDIWIVTHKSNYSDAFCAFRFGTNGLSKNPIISKLGSIHSPYNGFQSPGNVVGTMKISPTGKKLGLCNADSEDVEIYDFDPATGVVSNSLALDTNLKLTYGCEFSADGSKFYATGYDSDSTMFIIKQWDLASGSHLLIKASESIIGSDSAWFRSIQLAPNGKIYLGLNVPFFYPKFLSAITNPNAPNVVSGFMNQAVAINFGKCRWGLPNFIGSSLRQKPLLSASASQTCGIVSFSFTPYNYSPAANYSVNSVAWDFGDPIAVPSNTSALTAPQHTYSANGHYTVTLIVHYDCYTDTIRKEVTVNSLPDLTVSGDSVLCKGESRTLVASGALSYSWNTGAQNASVTVSPTITTTYTVTGTDAGGCAARKVFSVSVDPCAGLTPFRGESFRIYPVPASGMITVQTNSRTERVCVMRLFEVTGVLAAEYHIDLSNGSATVAVNALADGLYFAEIEDSNVRTARVPVIVRR